MLSDIPVITVSKSKGKSINYPSYGFVLVLSLSKSIQKLLDKMVDSSTFILEKVKQKRKEETNFEFLFKQDGLVC
jgi:hypothetical protein